LQPPHGTLIHPEEWRLARKALLHIQCIIITEAIPPGKRVMIQLDSAQRRVMIQKSQRWSTPAPASTEVSRVQP